jgi:hypothetical protein
MLTVFLIYINRQDYGRKGREVRYTSSSDLPVDH